jgi:hypothetical protein
MRFSSIHFCGGLRVKPLFLMLAACGWALGFGHCGVPQPPCVFYGQARDEYGYPYLRDAEVILRIQGRVCSRWPILGMLAPGVNFKLPLELDDGATTSYASYAAHSGQTVTISVRAQGGERPIIETAIPTVGQSGDLIGIYTTTGTDTDGDGLPDAWEQILIENSGGALTDVTQVLGQDDFDADGVSNLDEYRAGTYAFLQDDFPKVEEVTRLTNGKVRLRFLTTPGISYRAYQATQLGTDAVWNPVRLTLTEADGATSFDAVVGNGNFVSVYVGAAESIQFYRLVAQ